MVELEVADVTERELEVEVQGPVVTVRGDQLEPPEERDAAFRLHERLEESFRLPDDADPDGVRAFLAHGTLGIHAPRRSVEPRRVPIEHGPWRLNPAAQPC